MKHKTKILNRLFLLLKKVLWQNIEKIKHCLRRGYACFYMRFIPSLLQWSFGQGTLQFWWWQIFVADGQKNGNVGGLHMIRITIRVPRERVV